MQIQLPPGDEVALKPCPATERAYHAGIQTDLEFLCAWEDGRFPELCYYLRVRQIHKGNPILVAQRLLRKVDVRKTYPSL